MTSGRHILGVHLRRLALYSLLIVIGLLFIVPYLWMVSAAFKQQAQVWVYPPQWIPNPWVFGNFQAALAAAPLARYFLNTFIVALGIIVERLLFITVAAYAFARLRFPGRDLIFIALLATMMIPEQVTLIPLYLVVRGLDWTNTYHGIFLPSLANAFVLFWLRQFFMTIPTELEDAARIDGCSRLGVLFRIFLPLSKPGLAVLCLWSFNEAWNMFMWPLIVTDTPEMRTIEVGMAYLRLAYGGMTGADEVTWLMAGNTLATIPVIAAFLLVQRHMVQAVTFSGLKG